MIKLSKIKKNFLLKTKNFSFKSKIKTLIKSLFNNKNTNIYKYKLIIKNLDIITDKNIINKNKSANIKNFISCYFKKNNFFNFL